MKFEEKDFATKHSRLHMNDERGHIMIGHEMRQVGIYIWMDTHACVYLVPECMHGYGIVPAKAGALQPDLFCL